MPFHMNNASAFMLPLLFSYYIPKWTYSNFELPRSIEPSFALNWKLSFISKILDFSLDAPLSHLAHIPFSDSFCPTNFYLSSCNAFMYIACPWLPFISQHITCSTSELTISSQRSSYSWLCHLAMPSCA